MSNRKKLTWAIVRAVREAALDTTRNFRQIGDQFGLAQTRVASLVRGNDWKDPTYIPPPPRKRNKLEWPEVRQIRSRWAAGERARHLAHEFKVTPAAIHFLVTGVHWRNDPQQENHP